MSKFSDIALTAFAPMAWGSTYYVTTEFLPAGYPITAAMLRALPAGLILLLLVRQLPAGQWWWRLLILGALNFSIFWVALFIAAYRLPGGVAATVGAIQPLIVIFLARMLLGNAIKTDPLFAVFLGFIGVALLVLDSSITLDAWGLVAAIGGAASMAMGTVLTKKWQPPVPLLTFTAWQLTAGGILLLPVAIYFEPPLPTLTPTHLLGFLWLGLVGAALSYFVWFRGVIKLDVATVSILGFFSPLTAVILGWALLGQELSDVQQLGIVAVLFSIWLSQNKKRFSLLLKQT